MLPENIADEELLYRLVADNQDFFDIVTDSISSAVFKDKRGVSVDRDGGRDERDVITFFDSRKSPDMGLVRIDAATCRRFGALPVARPLNDNPFHAEIHQSETKTELSRSCRKELARHAHLLRPPLIGRAQE